MFKICIWENISSPHQSYFFKALTNHSVIDLQVRYFETFHEERKSLGWEDNVNLPENEQYVNSGVDLALNSMNDWQQRIHIIPGLSYAFTNALLDRLVTKNVKWVHWSERSGIGLARKLHYNVSLFNLLQPIVSKVLKKKYADKINLHAIGVFAQGQLAKNDFIGWGVRRDKIEYLFYTVGRMCKPTALPEDFSLCAGRKIFLFAGSLDKHKGIKELLISFAALNNRDCWRLMLVGQDKSSGNYLQMVTKLGIEESVVFTGPKKIETISQYIGSADVFILPSLYDGWGAVLNEAAALGKPIISTDQTGSAFHLINENLNGFRVKAGCISELTKVMQFYIDNPGVIIHHGVQSEMLYNNFTPKMNVERFISAIQKWTSGEKH